MNVEVNSTPQKKNQGVGALILIPIVLGYLGFLIVTPIAALIDGAFQNGLEDVWYSLISSQMWEAVRLSVKIAVGVVIIQAILGTITAWVIVRHNFRGKSILNGIIEIPFTISPVVVGYMLLLVFGRTGLLGPLLERFDWQIAFAVPGMFLATLFVSLPFMIREMVPVIENLDYQQELAAATLGANRLTIFWRVIFPPLQAGLIYGMTLTLARALGEFGAVLVIGGGVQGRTETATLFIFHALEERQYVDAYTTSLLLGLFSVVIVSLADWLRDRFE